MKIEAGEFYKTKSGEIVGPMFWDEVISVWRRSKDFRRNSGDYWHKDGKRYGYVEDDMDIISKMDGYQK